MIYERKFNDRGDLQGKSKKTRNPPPSAKPLLGGKAGSKNPWGDLSELKERAKELISKYKIIRGSDFSLAVKLKLNKEEEVAVEEEEPVAEAAPVDPKKKK